VTPIAAAAFKGNDRVVEILLAHGVDPNAVDKTGKAPILYAAALGFTPVVRRLLDAGVDVNARYGNDLTVLMWAAGYAENAGALDAEAVVKLVLDRGGAIDAVDNRGRSALMTAAEFGHAGIVEILLARGANRTLRDKQGKSALDLAADQALRDRLVAKQ
jgi:ankyrin repeat protein